MEPACWSSSSRPTASTSRSTSHSREVRSNCKDRERLDCDWTSELQHTFCEWWPRKYSATPWTGCPGADFCPHAARTVCSLCSRCSEAAGHVWTRGGSLQVEANCAHIIGSLIKRKMPFSWIFNKYFYQNIITTTLLLYLSFVTRVFHSLLLSNLILGAKYELWWWSTPSARWNTEDHYCAFRAVFSVKISLLCFLLTFIDENDEVEPSLDVVNRHLIEACIRCERAEWPRPHAGASTSLAEVNPIWFPAILASL